MLASSVVAPFTVGTRELPSAVSDQVHNVFERVGLLLGAANGGWDDVLRMTFFVAGPDSRDAVDQEWITHFPDPDARPARHTQVATLPKGMEVQCEFLAYLAD
ncbi:RidA family protein [Pseudonocardia alni]|uniref:RidA family protein n=1 Tax=Pseudonocardia alni TaxID=33907 RepID=UPI0033ECFDDF